MFPASGCWKLSPCPALHLPFFPQWESGALSSVWSNLPELGIILLPRMWEICRTRVIPEARPRFTLRFPAAASLFPWGCCYSFKNKHPRNSLLKQASPLQIQLCSFSWVIFSPCRIFGSWGVFSFTGFIKKHGPATGKARGIFTLLTPRALLAQIFFFFFSPLETRAGQTEAAPPRQTGSMGLIPLRTGQDGAWATQGIVTGKRKRIQDVKVGNQTLSFMLAEIMGCISF